jgi:hypothetical protein
MGSDGSINNINNRINDMSEQQVLDFQSQLAAMSPEQLAKLLSAKQLAGIKTQEISSEKKAEIMSEIKGLMQQVEDCFQSIGKTLKVNLSDDGLECHMQGATAAAGSTSDKKITFTNEDFTNKVLPELLQIKGEIGIKQLRTACQTATGTSETNFDLKLLRQQMMESGQFTTNNKEGPAVRHMVKPVTTGKVAAKPGKH